MANRISETTRNELVWRVQKLREMAEETRTISERTIRHYDEPEFKRQTFVGRDILIDVANEYDKQANDLALMLNRSENWFSLSFSARSNSRSASLSARISAPI